MTVGCWSQQWLLESAVAVGVGSGCWMLESAVALAVAVGVGSGCWYWQCLWLLDVGAVASSVAV